MKVFVVHHTIFDYKPGHMYLCCNGVYLNWNDALKKALSLMLRDDDEEEECQEAKIPTTRAELEQLLPERGCVWTFENEGCAEWWDGDDCGSKLISISLEDVRDNGYISPKEEEE